MPPRNIELPMTLFRRATFGFGACEAANPIPMPGIITQ